MRNWFKMRAGAGPRTAEIMIYDEIGPSYFGEPTVDAKGFLDSLKALGELDEITLRINSPGGDVFHAIAIHNALAAHPARVVAKIDGLAASAASYIAMAADMIVAPSNSFVLVHAPRTVAWGTAEDMLAVAADLENMTASMIATYAARSKQDADAVRALMAEDRLMTAEEAKALGYVDALADPVRMAASYSLERLPLAARAALEAVLEPEAPAEPEAVEAAHGAAEGQETPIEEDRGSEQPDEGAVISLADVRREAREAAMRDAASITALCAQAGLPQMAADLIGQGRTVEEARAAVFAARAEAADKSAIRHQSNGTDAQSSKAAWARVIEAFNRRAR